MLQHIAQTVAEGWSPGQDVAYIVAAICFIIGIRRLRAPKTARSGNTLASLGMLIAIAATVIIEDPQGLGIALAGIVVGGFVGAILAARVKMTQMPQMVALFNGFGGIASALVASGEWVRSRAGIEPLRDDALIAIGLSILIGGVTFTGSIVAAGKLHGSISGKPVLLPGQMAIAGGLLAGGAAGILWMTTSGGAWAPFAIIAVASLALGVVLTMPIGGADMPVMVSLLNSYSGLAASATGFVIVNKALIVSGALVGASGLILTAIMCKAMNRSLANVLFAGVGSADSTGTAMQAPGGGVVKSADPDDVAIMLDSAQQVMIVPGYGLAVAQAQHAVREMARALEERGARVLYAIHPVAGRMPGHMNVLLAEADVPYERLLELEPANAEIERTDIALVIGANDVVNPAARHDTASPIFGMPIVDVDKARTVFVLKRSLGAGYAGVDNELFVGQNTVMVFGDAKKTIDAINTALADL